MPAKFKVKTYKVNSYYHLYNKGVGGWLVFGDDQDMEYYETLIGEYLGYKKETKFSIKPSVEKQKATMRLEGEIKVFAYCLMTDHFHILVWQKNTDSVVKFMRRINTAYVMYYNKKYSRRGPLFEGIYKAVLISGKGKELNNKLLYLSRHIHLNPVTKTERRIGPVRTVVGTGPEEYKYSSYRRYIGNNSPIWVSILFNDKPLTEYATFVRQPQKEEPEILGNLLLD